MPEINLSRFVCLFCINSDTCLAEKEKKNVEKKHVFIMVQQEPGMLVTQQLLKALPICAKQE